MTRDHKSISIDSEPDQPTRLCAVDPRTGELLVPTLAGSDATRLLPHATDSSSKGERRTGEFIPSQGTRTTSELTVPWQEKAPKPSWREKLRQTAAQFSLSPGRRRWWGVAVLVTGLAATAASLPRERHESGNALRASTSPAAMTPTQDTTSVPRDSIGISKESSPTPTLSEAVVAVAEGRYEEALRLYEALSRAAPDDESYSLALAILRQVSPDRGEKHP